jgi:hypothetical protein
MNAGTRPALFAAVGAAASADLDLGIVLVDFNHAATRIERVQLDDEVASMTQYCSLIDRSLVGDLTVIERRGRRQHHGPSYLHRVRRRPGVNSQALTQ